MSLLRKATYGVAWVSVSTITVQLFYIITTIILARVLDPADFGLFALGILVINTLSLFRDLGTGPALVQRKEEIYTAANTAFTLTQFVGFVLFIFSYFFASIIATFFKSPLLEPIIKILSFTFLISSIGVIPSFLLEKELEFKKRVLPDMLSIIGYSIVSISLAFFGYGVWSLVGGQIALTIILVITLWFVSSWRPKIKFNKGDLISLLGYGKHMVGAALAIFLITNLDDAVVGKVIGASALGFYTMAYKISNIPATNLTHLVNKVMFPTYSKLQEDNEKLGAAYLKVLKYISLISMPVSFGILAIAPEFVNIVLGEKWAPMIPALQILCFFGLFRSIAASTGEIFKAVGKPYILFLSSFFQLIGIVLFIYPLTKWLNIYGTSIVVTLSIFVVTIWQIIKVCEILGIKSITIARFLSQYLLSSGMMLFSVLMAKKVLSQGFLSLFLLILIGILVYSISIYLLTRGKILYEIKEIFLILRQSSR